MDAGTAEKWLITFTKQLRSKLPSSSNYIITHARLSSHLVRLPSDTDGNLVRYSGRSLVSFLPESVGRSTQLRLTDRFTPSHYPGGGYLKVNKEVGSSIDWVRILSHCIRSTPPETLR